MHSLLSYDLACQDQRDRHVEAAAYNRAVRLGSVRRRMRRAKVATYRARLARLAIR
jgi:hypothetical protein